MKKLLLPALASGLIALSSHAQTTTEAAPVTDTSRLTIDRLYASPSLNGPSPRGVKFSPDGKRVTFLKSRESDQSRFDLWQFDVATGQPSMLVDSTILEPEEVELSEEEKALRERKRIAGSKGIVSYDWGTAETILVPIGGDLHLVSLGEDGVQARQLTETDAFEYDAKVSPAGQHVSFIRDGAVYAIDLSSGEEKRLTPLAEPDKALAYGVAEFVAQEEMSRYTGYWWNSNDRYIAYTRVDESTVDVIERFDIKADETTVINQRYPRAGRPNAVVDLFVRDLQTGEVTQIDWRRKDWGPATNQYLARAYWSLAEGAPKLIVQRVNRDQTVLDYLEVVLSQSDASIAESYTVHSEQQDNWINLNDDFNPSSEGSLWSGEESGFRSLYFAPADQNRDAYHIVSEDWPVKDVVGYDRSNKLVYFTGHRETPLEQHLYKVSYSEPGQPTRVTEAGKSWAISMAPDGQSFVGKSSSPNQPTQTGLYRADGTLIAWIEENVLNEDHPYAPYLASHTVPDYGTLTADDGQTLYYSIQMPPGFDPAKSYPALVEVYGGPGAQTVTRNWERLTDQFYTHQDYIVFRLDNRGMANRGKQFEDVIYRQTGGPEVRDQLVGVEWLKSQPFVDADRIAIQGWSYGGYMALMTILQAPEGTFAAAVAGAPVTDWTLYDTFYTERYMDTPQDNPDGYSKSSVFYHLDKFESEMPPLLLVHGMADDNVTFDNTTRLMAELQQRGTHFDLMTYPGQRHGIRGERLQKHLMKTRMAFLERHLKSD